MQVGSLGSRATCAHISLPLLFVTAVVLGGCASAPSSPPPQAPTSTPTPPQIETTPDAVPRLEPRSAKGNPPFYTVLGKRYFVMPDAAGYVERGIASWYGPGFHDGLTSNGEKYDMHAMTAAHKTLPLPTYVQVTNLRNGKSIVVRVNDRGPFKDGRIIDLSRTAAAKLDMLRDGTTFVEVRALTSLDTPASPAAPSSGIFVQAGAFSSEANAASLVERLRTKGVENGFVRRDDVDGRTLYRVRVGPVPSVGEFDRLVAKLRSLGVTDARLAAD